MQVSSVTACLSLHLSREGETSLKSYYCTVLFAHTFAVCASCYHLSPLVFSRKQICFREPNTCLESATACDRLLHTCYYSPQKSPTRLPSRRLVLYQTPYVSYARMPFSAPGLAYSVLFPPLLPDRTYVPRNRVSSVRSYLERRYRVYQSRYYATSLAVSAHPPLPGRHANVTGRETRV